MSSFGKNHIWLGTEFPIITPYISRKVKIISQVYFAKINLYRLYRTVFVMDLHCRLTVQTSLLLADVNTASGRHRLESDWRHDQVSVRGGTAGTGDRQRSIFVSYKLFEHYIKVCDQLCKRFSLIFIFLIGNNSFEIL